MQHKCVCCVVRKRMKNENKQTEILMCVLHDKQHKSYSASAPFKIHHILEQ